MSRRRADARTVLVCPHGWGELPGPVRDQLGGPDWQDHLAAVDALRAPGEDPAGRTTTVVHALDLVEDVDDLHGWRLKAVLAGAAHSAEASASADQGPSPAVPAALDAVDALALGHDGHTCPALEPLTAADHARVAAMVALLGGDRVDAALDVTMAAARAACAHAPDGLTIVHITGMWDGRARHASVGALRHDGRVLRRLPLSAGAGTALAAATIHQGTLLTVTRHADRTLTASAWTTGRSGTAPADDGQTLDLLAAEKVTGARIAPARDLAVAVAALLAEGAA